MNMTRKLGMIVMILHFSFFILHSTAQTLVLDECKQNARQNYPAIKQYNLIEKSRDLTISNAQKAWLPGISVSGFGVGFTDVMSASGATSQILGDMENYLVGGSVMLNQVIFDGGAISAQKNIARAKADVDAKQLDVNLYSINERVEQLFFGILMLDEQLNQVSLLLDDLSISENTVKSLIEGGLANQSDLDAVNVRQVQAEQQKIGLQAQRSTYLNMLGYFIGKNLTVDTKLAKPVNPSILSPMGEARPELSYYTSQENLLNAQRKALNSRLLPTLGAFGMGSIHNKIMPMMKAGILAGGLTLNWNIGALYTRKNDIASIENKRLQIAAQRETFLFNNQLQNCQLSGTIDNIRQQMLLDDKAVSLRESIRNKAEKKVKNGTETVNELLRDVNAVSEARQQKAIHEIQLLQEEYKLNTINGR